ncbi:hypothetical protein R69749_08188 [Paraburkholderia domus]|nr:hypothetical protein R70006_08143 [Paraburkholderia domus]CAE6901757.1 hypothetical protein R69749_08188 [Paraburkholderia domus]CAE6964788.1 hypothetical protein R70199_07613 [Paraburkholderia domus]
MLINTGSESSPSNSDSNSLNVATTCWGTALPFFAKHPAAVASRRPTQKCQRSGSKCVNLPKLLTGRGLAIVLVRANRRTGMSPTRSERIDSRNFPGRRWCHRTKRGVKARLGHYSNPRSI